MSLVEIKKIIPDIKLDLRYATTNNVTGVVLYDTARAFLHNDPCRALLKVRQQLLTQGYDLLVWDAYRPYAITKKLWELAPEKNKALTFANPTGGSIHNKGCAIDVTLIDMNSGKEAVMPSLFDDNTDKARPNYMEISIDVAARREVLNKAFDMYGFERDANEWWHFNWKDHEKYPILDLSFAELT